MSDKKLIMDKVFFILLQVFLILWKKLTTQNLLKLLIFHELLTFGAHHCDV